MSENWRQWCNIANKVGDEICEILLIQIPSQNSTV
jgi:hypothetical protein